MGFTSSFAEPDIWMKDCGDHYEYIAVYCDDLTIASRDPKAIADALVDTYDFKLKGTGPLKFLLGCDYFRDDDGVLCFAPKKYIEKMVETYLRLFGEKPDSTTCRRLKRMTTQSWTHLRYFPSNRSRSSNRL